MFARKTWRCSAAQIVSVCALALAGCSKQGDAPTATAEPKPTGPKPAEGPSKGGDNQPPVQSPIDTQAHDAVAKKIDALNGMASRDESRPGKPVVRALLGITKVTDEDLVEFAKLQTITGLWLNNTDVTDASMKVVASFKVLTELSLQQTKVTDTGLKELASLKNLNRLELNFTKVTDAGLKDLSALQRLKTLELVRTAVTDAGLKDLAALKSLTNLDLSFTQVTDAGVKELQNALPACKIERRQ